MKRRSNPIPYLILNIIVSAATTLGVLFAWDALRKPDLPLAPLTAQEGGLASGASATALTDPAAGGSQPGAGGSQPGAGGSQPGAEGQPAALVEASTPEPTPTNPPPGEAVIEIGQVVGAGDLEQEAVLLRRVGEGNLTMTGWRLVGSGGSEYRFTDQPALVLYKDGAVRIYTRTGADTVTELFWNRSEPAWRPGETLRLLDEQGSERASYRIP